MALISYMPLFLKLLAAAMHIVSKMSRYSYNLGDLEVHKFFKKITSAINEVSPQMASSKANETEVSSHSEGTRKKWVDNCKNLQFFRTGRGDA
jgi:hypothetical protein